MVEKIEERKKKFLDCLEQRARGERVGQLFELVQHWLDTHGIDDTGIVEMDVAFTGGRDMGDEIFYAMYGVELALKCGTGLMTRKYRYEPKKIDGVVYVALENPLDIHWRVNIGRIKLEEENNDEKGEGDGRKV